MRFIVPSGDLSNELQSLSKVINAKSPLAILECFLFEIGEGKIRITASDGENIMSAAIAIEDSEVAGTFAVPSHTILDAMRELPEQPLTFEIDMEALTIKVLYQNGMYNFTAMNADAYPRIEPMAEGTSVITITSSALEASLSRSLYATAQDEIRPVMNGVCIDLTPNFLAIVATDGHKLVRNRILSVKSDSPATFILPKKPAQLLKALAGREECDVVIKFNDKSAEIVSCDSMLSCRLIEGRYPNYNSIIPQENTNKLNIDRKVLLSALRRVVPFASSTELIRFHLEPGKLELKCEDIDFATRAQEKLSCNYEGTPMSIGFKGGQFLEVLSNLDCDELDILLADPVRAGIIMPSVQAEGEEVLVLIMPVLLND